MVNGVITKVVLTDGGQDYIPNTTELISMEMLEVTQIQMRTMTVQYLM